MIDCGGVSEHVLNVAFGDPTIGASDQGKSSGFVKLVQIIACPLVGAKPLSEPMLS